MEEIRSVEVSTSSEVSETEAIRKLKTVEEFKKEIPKEIKYLWIHDRWNNLIGRFNKPEGLKKFHNRLVFNYWEKDSETWCLYIST